MIHAKPLKRKHLGHVRSCHDSTRHPPTPDRYESEFEPNSNRIDTESIENIEVIKSKTPIYFKTKKLKELLILCIKAMPGSSAVELNRLALEFCKIREINTKLDGNGGYTSELLKSLTHEGKITRIKVAGAFRYYEIVN